MKHLYLLEGELLKRLAGVVFVDLRGHKQMHALGKDLRTDWMSKSSGTMLFSVASDAGRTGAGP